MTEVYKEYADALYEIAAEQGREREVYEGLELVAKLFAENPEYKDLLSSRSLSGTERNQVLEDAFGGKIPEELLSFLMLLGDKRRIREFDRCRTEYDLLYHNYMHQTTVLIKSAVPLGDDEKKRLQEAMSKRLNKEPLMQYQVDPALLGGIIVEYDGIVLDGSLRHRIKDLKEVITQ
ncbi:MAG: ATP synthase F1 subunit delta [Firmicutes bacterium]|nr:ATP synthase F1 subunit delta [Bacillota bacterium]